MALAEALTPLHLRRQGCLRGGARGGTPFGTHRTSCKGSPGAGRTRGPSARGSPGLGTGRQGRAWDCVTLAASRSFPGAQQKCPPPPPSSLGSTPLVVTLATSIHHCISHCPAGVPTWSSGGDRNPLTLPPSHRPISACGTLLSPQTSLMPFLPTQCTDGFHHVSFGGPSGTFSRVWLGEARQEHVQSECSSWLSWRTAFMS